MLFVTKKRGDQFYYVNQPVASKTDPYDAVTFETIIHTEQKDKSSALTARPWHFLSDIKVYHIVSRTINKLVKSNVTLISWWRHSTRWLIQKVNTKETRMMEGE